MMKIVIIFILLSLALTCSWATNDSQSQKTISGRISDVDKVGQIISVRYTDPRSGGADEVNIMVPDDAVITNGTKQWALCDLQQFDPVTVTYYDDGVSGLKAVRIADLNQSNR
ncbi:MAG: hypothetical protein WC543_06130 [Candidatus Omnitrophota bacterium]